MFDYGDTVDVSAWSEFAGLKNFSRFKKSQKFLENRNRVGEVLMSGGECRSVKCRVLVRLGFLRLEVIVHCKLEHFGSRLWVAE